jgi:hypothetical protein
MLHKLDIQHQSLTVGTRTSWLTCGTRVNVEADTPDHHVLYVENSLIVPEHWYFFATVHRSRWQARAVGDESQ